MRYLWVLLAMFVSGTAQAIDCREVPDCKSLGYSQNLDSNCAANGYLTCPFDSSYKKCVQYNCETLGFTQSDKSSWCADVATCKSDENYTLCQTPCIAWDSDTLSNLAGSGKCKVVTMKNDISIPENQDITLHTGTTIDGNGHTITVTKGTSFTLLDDTKLKNMHINRKLFTAEEFTLLFVRGNSFFEDISVLDEDKETPRATSGDQSLCLVEGTLTMNGALKFELEKQDTNPIFWGSRYKPEISKVVFENANTELISHEWPGNIFAYIGNVVAKDSEIQIKTNAYIVTGWVNPAQFELINSKMIIEKTDRGLSWLYEGKYTFKLGEGGYLDTKQNNLQAEKGEMHFMFAGTEGKPATLMIGKKYTGNMVTLDVQSTAATLIYNGKTYRPTNTGTTLLKDVENSGNWTPVQ